MPGPHEQWVAGTAPRARECRNHTNSGVREWCLECGSTGTTLTVGCGNVAKSAGYQNHTNSGVRERRLGCGNAGTTLTVGCGKLRCLAHGNARTTTTVGCGNGAQNAGMPGPHSQWGAGTLTRAREYQSHTNSGVRERRLECGNAGTTLTVGCGNVASSAGMPEPP
jgi:hypothetical protein